MDNLLKDIYESKETFLEAIIMAVKERELCKNQDFFRDENDLIGFVVINNYERFIDTYDLSVAFKNNEDVIPILKDNRERACELVRAMIEEIAVIDKAIESVSYWGFCKEQKERDK